MLRFPAVTGPHRIGWENSKPTKLALKPCPENKRAVKYKVLLKFDLLLTLSITSWWFLICNHLVDYTTVAFKLWVAMGVGKGGQISSVGDLTEVLALAKVLACLAVGSITSPCFGNEPGLLAWRKSSLAWQASGSLYANTQSARAWQNSSWLFLFKRHPHWLTKDLSAIIGSP